MKPTPPDKLSIRWCPECGRNDRIMPFRGKTHWRGGRPCKGEPISLQYIYWRKEHLP